MKWLQWQYLCPGDSDKAHVVDAVSKPMSYVQYQHTCISYRDKAHVIFALINPIYSETKPMSK